MEPETIYTSTFQPDPASALDVLAFLFAPARAFYGPRADAEEIASVEEILHQAKCEAVQRWSNLQAGPKVKA